MRTPDFKANRLELSRRVLESWEQMLFLGGNPAISNELIRREIAMLEEARGYDAERVDKLLNRYLALAKRTDRLH